MFLTRNEEVVALYFYLYAQTAEGIRNDSKIAQRYILYSNAVAHHGCHTDKRAYLNHIWQYAMLGSMQMLHSNDSDKIRGYAANIGSHMVEHMAKLLNVWFTGCIIDSCGSLCCYCSHNDVGSTGYGSLVEKHIASLQAIGLDLINIAFFVVNEVGSELIESKEMGVQASTTNLVASWFCHGSLAKTTEQRTYHEHATT